MDFSHIETGRIKLLTFDGRSGDPQVCLKCIGEILEAVMTSQQAF